MPTPSIAASKRRWFSLLATALVLLVAEVVARGWLYFVAEPVQYPKYALASEFPSSAKYQPHHYLGYRLTPGYRKGQTRHNRLGYRGDDFEIAKPPGRFRIVALGGSTTYTEFVDDDNDSWPSQLQRELRARLGRDDIDVINAGVPGYNSWESLADLCFRTIDLKPDLVLVLYGVNDIHARMVIPSAYAGDNSGRRTRWTPPIEVRLARYSCLARIIGYHLGIWRHPGVDAFVVASTSEGKVQQVSTVLGDPLDVLRKNPPIFLERNLRSTVGVARSNGAQVVFATAPHSSLVRDYASTPHYEEGFRENNRVVVKVANEAGALCLDLAALMPASREFWRDGRHVNKEGAHVQAILWADFLIKERCVPPPLDKGTSRARGERETASVLPLTSPSPGRGKQETGSAVR